MSGRKLRSIGVCRKCRAGTFAGMVRHFRTHLLLALLALVCAEGWNRWNLRAMQASPVARQQVRDGWSVMAVDDASYLQGAERLLGTRPDLEQGPLADRPQLRPPGYGLLYLMPRLLLQPLPAVRALVWLQVVLYAAAVALLWETLVQARIPPAIRWPLALAFAALPTFHGFLHYTLTEGVTPSLALIVLCCALRAVHAPHPWLRMGLIAWGLLLLTRPVLGWAGLALLPALRVRGWRRAAASAALAAGPLLGWWAFNALRAGTPIGLHPVFRTDEPGINRPMHGAFWALAKSWGARGDAFHGVMEPAFRAALAGDTAARHVDGYIALAPPGLLAAPEEQAIRRAFAAWQRFNATELAPAVHGPRGTLAGPTDSEQRILDSLHGITAGWRAAHPFHHHVRVPLRVLRGMVAHSNLNLWLFQHHLRGQPWMEALRRASALLHIGLLLCVPLAALLRVPRPLRLMAAGACPYLFYLAYVQRGVEERYTLPVLFIGVACAAFVMGRRDAEAPRTH